MLAVFNLVPVHPLDGFTVVKGLLPEDQSREWAQLERYGMFFLLVLIFFPGNPLQTLISPMINFFLKPFSATIRNCLKSLDISKKLVYAIIAW